MAVLDMSLDMSRPKNIQIVASGIEPAITDLGEDASNRTALKSSRASGATQIQTAALDGLHNEFAAPSARDIAALTRIPLITTPSGDEGLPKNGQRTVSMTTVPITATMRWPMYAKHAFIVSAVYVVSERVYIESSQK